MNITVYCGASAGSKPIYEQKASELGQWLAAHGITLVYGGGRTGLMGKLANAVLANGGKAIGVIPEFLKTAEEVHTGLNQHGPDPAHYGRHDEPAQGHHAPDGGCLHRPAWRGRHAGGNRRSHLGSPPGTPRQALHTVQHPWLLRPLREIIRPHGKSRLSQSSRPRKGEFRYVH